MTHILVTRPAGREKVTMKKLAEKALTATHCSVTVIEGQAFTIPQDVAAYIVTSVNGVKYGLQKMPDKTRPVFAVGTATAKTAKAEGFSAVISGTGSGKDLLTLIPRHFSPRDGKITHLSGMQIAVDFSVELASLGYEANRLIAYKVVPQPIEGAALEALKTGKVTDVLFYSAYALTIFEKELELHALQDTVEQMRALVLSHRIGEAAQMRWKQIMVADTPAEHDLLKLL